MTSLTTRPRRMRATRTSLLGDGWPLYVLLWGYPLWWVLGLSAAAWILLAVPCVFWLWGRESIRVPRGFGPWLLFLAWMLLSASQLQSFDDIRSFSVRAAFYGAAGIYLLFAYNLPGRGNHPKRLTTATFWFFGFVVVVSLAAAVLPFSEFTTPFELVLPRGLSQNQFVRELVHAQLAQVHTFLGFPVPRPAAPFFYTNQWGAAVGLLVPVALYAATRVRPGLRRVAAWIVLSAATLPVVYSLNRGLWLSLAAGAAYVAVRLAVQGRARPLFNLVIVTLLAGVIVLATPLSGLLLDRLDTGHSDDRRGSLVGKSIATIQESPILGHGGPIPDPESPSRAPIGTHGQLWLLGVSHGVPGILFYTVTLLVLWLRTLRGGVHDLSFWVNASLFIAAVQLPFYDHLYAPIQFLFILAGAALHQLDFRDPSRITATIASR